MDVEELRREARTGNVAAQAILGLCYLEGYGVEVDVREAFRLLSLAAASGAPRAMTALAKMYAEGLSTPKNLNEAIRLYTASAERGEFDAQIALGRIYATELANRDLAERWYRAALQQQSTVDSPAEIREAEEFLR